MEARYLRGGRLPRSRGDGMFSAPPRGRKRVVPEGSEQVAACHEGLRPDRPRRGAALSQARGEHKQGRHERVVRHPSRRLRVDAVAHGSARRRAAVASTPLDDSWTERWRYRRATCAREGFFDLAEWQRANCSRAGKRAALLDRTKLHKARTRQRANAPRTALKNSRPKSTNFKVRERPKGSPKSEDECVAQREVRAQARLAVARRKRQAGAGRSRR